jgi:hypothetical protein
MNPECNDPGTHFFRPDVEATKLLADAFAAAATEA